MLELGTQLRRRPVVRATRRPSNTATHWTYDKGRSSQSTVDAAQRTQLECPSSVATHLPAARPTAFVSTQTRRAAVRKHRNATDRTHTHQHSVQQTPQRTSSECPFSVATHAGRHAPHSSGCRSTQTRRARPETRQRNEPTTKPDHHKSTVDAVTHALGPLPARTQTRSPAPHLERVVARPRHDAPPVRKYGNAMNLRRSQIITKTVDAATQLPSALPAPPGICRSPRPTPVLSRDADTTRRPSGNTATHLTTTNTSSQDSGRRNARNSSALPASPRTRRSPRSHLERLVVDPETTRRRPEIWQHN